MDVDRLWTEPPAEQVKGFMGGIMMAWREKIRKTEEASADGMKMIESTLEKMESRLHEMESSIATLTKRGKELEQRVDSRVIDLQNQIREKMAPGGNPDSSIPLEEGYAVDLEDLEKKMEEKYSLLAARERALQDLQERILADFKNLKAEIKERDFFLAAEKMEIKNFKQAVAARIEMLEMLLKEQAGDKKMRPRMLSFLVDIGKKTS